MSTKSDPIRRLSVIATGTIPIIIIINAIATTTGFDPSIKWLMLSKAKAATPGQINFS